jgi:hypothetical protein
MRLFWCSDTLTLIARSFLELILHDNGSTLTYLYFCRCGIKSEGLLVIILCLVGFHLISSDPDTDLSRQLLSLHSKLFDRIVNDLLTSNSISIRYCYRGFHRYQVNFLGPHGSHIHGGSKEAFETTERQP